MDVDDNNMRAVIRIQYILYTWRRDRLRIEHMYVQHTIL